MPLKGLQLSLVPDVKDYLLENPPQPGDTITTRSGKAVVKSVEQIGLEPLIWGDYGSGIPQPHVQESLLPPEQPFKVGDRVIASKFKNAVPAKVVAIFGAQIEVQFDQADISRPVVTGIYLANQFKRYPPEQVDEVAHPKHRRYSPKGKASGWIEKREGNKQRQKPSINYYYCWDTPTSRQKLYIPVRKRWRVQQMVEEERRSIEEVLEFLKS